MIGRFTTIDRYTEKYHNINSYQYALNSPISNIDINGDSVYVAIQYRELMNKVLSSVFGKSASDFGYNKNGMLTYTGNTKGFSSEQSGLLKGLSGIMDEKITTNIIFGQSTELTLNDGTKRTLNALESGGAASALVGEANVSQNTILVDPKSSEGKQSFLAVTNAYYISPVDPSNGPRFEQKTMQTDMITNTFHEIGHVIYRGNTQDKVLDYENRARKQLGLPKWPYDETHNRTVKQGRYEN